MKSLESKNVSPLSLLTTFESILNSKDIDDESIVSFINNFDQNKREKLIPKPPIKYPVFQGGGAKGNAYIGAYLTLDEQGYLEEVACPGGASAGGIVAFFMALGFNGKQFKYASEKMNFLDFTDLKKDGWGSYLNGSKIGIALDLIQHGAAYSGENFHKWASNIVEQILGDKNATFKDLHDKKMSDPTLKDLLLVATHYGTENGVHAEQVFSFETTPNVVLADALRATMAFPGAFAPWQVREKVITAKRRKRSEVTFKSLGFYADGGILDNLPIMNFNSKQYADQSYHFLERRNQHGTPIQVNPCTLSFSLTALENLDKAITPFSPKIEAAVTANKKKIVAKPKQTTQTWHYSDLAKAGLWSLYGKPETENVQDKHKILFDQTVQIWPQDVGTLEFDLLPERFKSLVENGKTASEQWLKAFRNPSDSYAHRDSFYFAPTKEQELLKEENPALFYKNSLNELVFGFAHEINKLTKQNQNEDGELLQNIRLQYLAHKINKIITKARTKHLDIKGSFREAILKYQQYRLQYNEHITKRWELLNPEKVVDNLCHNMLTQPKMVLRILKGQLSNVIPLCKIDKARLLLNLVKNNNHLLAKAAFKIINQALTQQYHQGKISDPKKAMSDLINENPTILSYAVMQNNISMLNLLLSYGAKTDSDVCFEAIHADYALFPLLINNDNAPINITELDRGGKLIHTLFNNASPKFIEQFCKDEVMFKTLFNTSADYNGKNIFHHLASKGTATLFASCAYEAIEAGNLSLLGAKDGSGKTPLSYLIAQNRMDVISELILQGKGRNKGYIYNADYHLDDVFTFDISKENRQALILHDHINPTLVSYILNNLNNKKIANELRRQLVLNPVKMINQPFEEIESNKIVQPFTYRQFELSKMPKAANDDKTKAEHIAKPNL